MTMLKTTGLLTAQLSLCLSLVPLASSVHAQTEEARSSQNSSVLVTLASEARQTNLSTDDAMVVHPVLTLDKLVSDSIADFVKVADGIAQIQPTETEAALNGSSNFRILPRFGAGYTSDGGSYSRLGRLEAFVPLWQDLGELISFVEGRLVFGEDEAFGSSLLLGYRRYSDRDNRVRGGYIGLDARDTGNSDFYQLGTGYESLGEDWDFRFNAYVPLGDRSNTLNDISIDTGYQVTSGFLGNQFVLSSQREQQRLFQREVALGGFDAEAGYRLLQWNDGDLRSFGGIYLYGAPDLATYLGWRLRLAANFTPNFNGGLTLQDDGLFGTRLILSVGASFPANHAATATDGSDVVRARLGDSVVRLPALAVYLDEDTETSVEVESLPLLNPEEEAAYRFQHVVLGATGGDGSFERPFGTVQEALAATIGDGNDVVYIDGGNNSTIPAFAIPNRVQVLSQGPVQTLAGLPFPGFESRTVRLPFSSSFNFTDGIAVALPFSGDGNFPSIQNGVTLGDRTVLAGFQIEGATGDAIIGTNTQNAEIRNNSITNAGGSGIALNNVGGSVVLFDNIIRNTVGSGIFAQNTTSDRPLDLAVIGYEIDAANVGMEFSTMATGGIAGTPSQIIAVRPSNAALNTSQGHSGGAIPTNAITNSFNEGLIVRSQGAALATAATQEFSLESGTITGNGSSGISVLTNLGAGSQEFSLINSVVSFNNGAGIEIRNGTTNPTATAYAQEIFIRGNQISNNVASGVDIALNAVGAQEITVDANQILSNGGDGIRSVASLAGLQEFPLSESGSAGISNNVISGNAEQAIDVEVNDSATLAVLNVRNNEIQNNGGSADIDVRATTTTTRTCAVVLDNTVPAGIELHTVSVTPVNRAFFLVQNLNTLSFENNGALVQLINDSSGLPDTAAFSDETNFCVP